MPTLQELQTIKTKQEIIIKQYEEGDGATRFLMVAMFLYPSEDVSKLLDKVDLDFNLSIAADIDALRHDRLMNGREYNWLIPALISAMVSTGDMEQMLNIFTIQKPENNV